MAFAKRNLGIDIPTPPKARTGVLATAKALSISRDDAVCNDLTWNPPNLGLLEKDYPICDPRTVYTAEQQPKLCPDNATTVPKGYQSYTSSAAMIACGHKGWKLRFVASGYMLAKYGHTLDVKVMGLKVLEGKEGPWMMFRMKGTQKDRSYQCKAEMAVQVTTPACALSFC